MNYLGNSSSNNGVNNQIDLNRELLRFTLLLYNNPLICRSAVQDIIENVSHFISNSFIPFLQQEIAVELGDNTDSYTKGKVKLVLEENKFPLSNFATEYMRFKMYAKESMFAFPNEFKIGEQSFISSSSRAENKALYAVHMPLQHSLKVFFEIPGVYHVIKNYTKALDEEEIIISNVMQGNLWKRKYKCIDNREIFPIFLFYDDFETGNPLGSHAGEQKFGGVYISLPCLPPHLASKLNSIFVSTIFYAKQRSICGNRSVFQKAISDLKVISENGVNVLINGTPRTLYFECVLLVGDNLGLNSCCGFSEGFTAKYYCRICRATSEQCKSLTVEDLSLLRTKKNYENDLKEGDIGIKEECVFNELKNFHITENQTVDIMHDVFEGVAVDTISKVLTTFVNDLKLFSFETLNNRIKNFDYGDLENSNKPRLLTMERADVKEGKILGSIKVRVKQSSSEMACLSRYLGLMIGDLIPYENEYWKLYKKLREIISIITSPRFVKSDVLAVKKLIQDHHSLFIKLYGYLKPKHHMMIHIPRLMLENGPMIHFWAMPFERKNSHLKETAVGTMSSKNLPMTLAIRNQLQLSCMKESFSCSVEDTVLGSLETDKMNLLDMKRFFPKIEGEFAVQSYKYVEINGKKYSNGTIFLIGTDHDGPKFGELKTILQIENDIYFASCQF